MRPKRATIPIESHVLAVQVTDDSSRTLIHPSEGFAYHSASGGLAETKHVYLDNSGVSDRLADHQPTSVLEIGLGTGMALLLTVDAAAAAGTELRYTAVENNWLGTDVLRRLKLEQLVGDPEIAESYLNWRDSLGETVAPGVHRHSFGLKQTAMVHHVDALQWEPEPGDVFDAIYFDPFAPNVNPELWTADFFCKLHAILRPDARLVTYCVNRKVREDLSSAGFDPHRVPGPPGGKREVMVAVKNA